MPAPMTTPTPALTHHNGFVPLSSGVSGGAAVSVLISTGSRPCIEITAVPSAPTTVARHRQASPVVSRAAPARSPTSRRGWSGCRCRPSAETRTAWPDLVSRWPGFPPPTRSTSIAPSVELRTGATTESLSQPSGEIRTAGESLSIAVASGTTSVSIQRPAKSLQPLKNRHGTGSVGEGFRFDADLRLGQQRLRNRLETRRFGGIGSTAVDRGGAVDGQRHRLELATLSGVARDVDGDGKVVVALQIRLRNVYPTVDGAASSRSPTGESSGRGDIDDLSADGRR